MAICSLGRGVTGLGSRDCFGLESRAVSSSGAPLRVRAIRGGGWGRESGEEGLGDEQGGGEQTWFYLQRCRMCFSKER